MTASIRMVPILNKVQKLQGSDDDDKAVLYALHVLVTADESYSQ
jgi:hypothetical protein